MKNKNNQKKQSGEIGVDQLKSLLRDMMITSPLPWKIQEKTGDLIDANGRFVARVGWGIEKFKHPVDQNNRDLILKAVQFYMEQKRIETSAPKIAEESINEDTISTMDEPTALAYTKMTEDGIEDVEPAIHATDEMRANFLKNQLKVEQ